MRSAWVVFLFAACCFFNSECFGQSVTSADLIGKAREYDGKSVVYSGEVIGDVMTRGNFVWVNVNDGFNAVGIYIPQALAKDVRTAGSYKKTGDVIEITGKFNRVCLEHGGDLDIHAENVKMVIPGRAKAPGVDKTKKLLALQLLGALIVIWILSLLKNR